MKKVLLIEDDSRVAAAIARIMAGRYHVNHVGCAEEGLAAAFGTPPDLILLDLHLPDLDGIEVCRRLRERPQTRDTPLILLSGNPDVERRVQGLLKGADDFLAKPFDGGELIARVIARLRRRGLEQECEEPVTLGNLRLEPGPAEASVGDARLPLSHLEFRMLMYLARKAGQLVSRQQMLSDLWPDSVVSRRTVDTHVANLRKKLRAFDGSIETVYGGGYMLRPPEKLDV